MMNRIVIYPSDIIILTGKSESYARKDIQRIKKDINKKSHQKLTITEYCQYYGFDLEEVLKVLSKFEHKRAS